jgi:hypothetical protein
MNIVSRLTVLLLAVGVLSSLNGCAVAAFPCRVLSATVKIVPVVGHGAAVPFDACSAAID